MSPTPKGRIGWLSWFLAWLLSCPAALALQSVTLGWSPSTDPSAVGSAVYYGTNSGNYPTRLDAGTNATITVTGLQEGVTYFFVATAYDSSGQESVPSNEVSYQVPLTNSPPTVALTSPTAGASYGAPASINLAATVVPNGHTISQVQFYSGATLLGQSASAPVAITVTSLPPPRDNSDVGTLSVAGTASESAGTFTVSGAGNVSGSADDFQFVYQTLSGDGQIQARLNSVQNTGPNGCVAVMIRETLTSGSRYGLMGISPDGVFRFQYRNSAGNKTTSTISNLGAPPAAWVRLVRSNNLLSGYESTDGTTWTFVDSQNVKMASEVYVGLAVASGDPGVLNNSTFSNVDVLP